MQYLYEHLFNNKDSDDIYNSYSSLQNNVGPSASKAESRELEEVLAVEEQYIKYFALKLDSICCPERNPLL